MDQKSIGIILPKSEWNRLAHKQVNDDFNAHVFQYAKRGEDLDLEVIFFNIDGLLVNEHKGKAFIIKENTIIVRGLMEFPSVFYNPKIYHRKKNKRTIFELSKKNGVTVINERNIIKKKHLFDFMESKAELKNYIDKQEVEIQPLINFHILGQKNFPKQWDIPIWYAKGPDNEIISFEEAFQILEQNQIEIEETKEKFYQVSNKILEMFHYYYPGLFEIGLQFVVKKNGEIKIQSTCAIDTIVNDMSQWNEKLYQEIVHWPIELANDILVNHIQSDEMVILNSSEESEPNQQLIGNSVYENNYPQLLQKTDHIDMNIWVKFKVFQDDEMMLQLPDRIANRLTTPPFLIQFGVKEEPCQSFVFEDAIPLRNNSFQHPVNLYVSSALVKKMHIPLDFVYQIHFSDGKALIGPTIGFLLGEKNQYNNLDYMEKFNDRLGVYKRFGGLIIAFSPRSVDWDKRIAYGMVYDPVKKHWRYDSAPIPATIYRRNFHQNQKHIKQLVELTENNLFNSYHFKKSDLYLLRDEPEIEDHLPTTSLLNNIEELIDFLREKKKVILKPVSSSRGRGIFILEMEEENEEGFIFYDYSNNMKVQHMVEDLNDLKSLLNKFGILNQDYLFQTYIPLLKVNNRSFDVRVVMQKYNKMKWFCSGIECRVAGENEDLTNIARGGEAMTLEEVIYRTSQGLSYSFVHRSILNLCHRFCYLLDTADEHFAEFGLDIALDENGYPWILEANIYPSFKGFKLLDYETYLRIRQQPLFYSVQIQGFQILDDEAIAKVFHFREKSYL